MKIVLYGRTRALRSATTKRLVLVNGVYELLTTPTAPAAEPAFVNGKGSLLRIEIVLASVNIVDVREQVLEHRAGLALGPPAPCAYLPELPA